MPKIPGRTRSQVNAQQLQPRESSKEETDVSSRKNKRRAASPVLAPDTAPTKPSKVPRVVQKGKSVKEKKKRKTESNQHATTMQASGNKITAKGTATATAARSPSPSRVCRHPRTPQTKETDNEKLLQSCLKKSIQRDRHRNVDRRASPIPYRNTASPEPTKMPLSPSVHFSPQVVTKVEDALPNSEYDRSIYPPKKYTCEDCGVFFRDVRFCCRTCLDVIVCVKCHDAANGRVRKDVCCHAFKTFDRLDESDEDDF
eukprot:m.48136 g.48136  ORF g.48136 m.48136 type:complete len:257 (-) comp15252_c1_seq4:2025-2795(-)